MGVLSGPPHHPGQDCFWSFGESDEFEGCEGFGEFEELDGFEGLNGFDGFEGLVVVLGIVLPTHAHQAVVVDIYSAPSKGTSPPHVDVDPPHYVVDPQFLFVVAPPFVHGGPES